VSDIYSDIFTASYSGTSSPPPPPGDPVTNLFTQAQVEALALTVGFTARNARIAAAIAMCEAPAFADGKPHADFDAVGDQKLADDVWGYSYGAMQIRSLRAHKGTGKTRDEDRLLDPEFNLRSAREIRIAAGPSWRPWSTFANGAYKAYLLDEEGQVAFPVPSNAYRVVAGDTLSGIARKIQADSGYTGPAFTWQQLAGANGLHDPYIIRIGDVLLVPGTIGTGA
jgi:nucleoid-associated protein YgaU